jgi:hypothetical protein
MEGKKRLNYKFSITGQKSVFCEWKQAAVFVVHINGKVCSTILDSKSVFLLVNSLQSVFFTFSVTYNPPADKQTVIKVL